MPNRNYIKRTIFLIILAIFPTIFTFAQNTKLPEPREQKLLNGLKLLTWTDPTAPKITVKVRIHSGSAFDPKDKMGVMALLSDILFPTDQTKAYFSEDLEGSLDVTTNYDYIQITATGKTDEVLSMIETLANAIANPQITQENFVKVRDARLKKVQELEKNPAYIADLAVAKRLFGDFPYGRSIEGTSESLAKIDRTDLIFAKQRFLTSDNATIAVIGNVKPDYIYKVVRQLFGAWIKADKLVPATFRSPEKPNLEMLKIPVSNIENNVIRIGMTGFARNDKDYYASIILTKIWQIPSPNNLPNNLSNWFVRNDAHLIRGAIYSGATLTNNSPEKISKEPFPKGTTENEVFEQIKSQVLADLFKNHISDLWLDVDTYKLISVQNEIQNLQKVTKVDVDRVMDDFGNKSRVIVMLERPKN